MTSNGRVFLFCGNGWSWSICCAFANPKAPGGIFLWQCSVRRERLRFLTREGTTRSTSTAFYRSPKGAVQKPVPTSNDCAVEVACRKFTLSTTSARVVTSFGETSSLADSRLQKKRSNTGSFAQEVGAPHFRSLQCGYLYTFLSVPTYGFDGHTYRVAQGYH